MNKQNLDLESIQALHQSGKLEEAKQGYLALLAINPRDAQLLHALSFVYAQQHDLTSAIQAIEKAVQLQPNNLTFLLHLANFYKAAGSYDKAIQILQDIISRDKHSAPAYNNLGTIYFLLGEYDQAIASYHTALTIAPDFVDAYYNMGLAQSRMQRFEAAIAAFQQILSLSPTHFAARFHLANAYMRQEDFKLAEKEFLHIEENHPFHLETQANLATCFLKQGALKEAKTHYKNALEISPNDTQVLYNLGIIYMQEGLFDEAIQYYQRSTQINPDYFEAHNNLGVAFIAKQHPEFALKHFKEALRLQPHNKSVGYIVEALSKKSRLLSAPSDYITALFDAYADHYDSHLNEALDYQVPKLLFEATCQFAQPAELTILDLGCGTGLCAEPFKQAKKIIGVDLSSQMLNFAKKKNLYAAVFQSDLTDFLQHQENQFDLILAGDVFVYMGDLEKIFSLSANALHPNGLMVFNTEITDECDFKINQSGRFQHNEKYIDMLAKKHYFQVLSKKEVQTRTQNSKPLIGQVYVLAKRP